MTKSDIYKKLISLEYKAIKCLSFEDYRLKTEYIELLNIGKKDLKAFKDIQSFYINDLSWVGIDLICEISGIQLPSSSDISHPNDLLNVLKVKLRLKKLQKI